jgi:hypothetical protein
MKKVKTEFFLLANKERVKSIKEGKRSFFKV